MSNDNEEYEPENKRPRISVAITDEEQEALQELIPWGLQSVIVRTLMNGALSMIREYGEVALYALVTGKVSTLEVLKRVERSAKDGPNGPKK